MVNKLITEALDLAGQEGNDEPEHDLLQRLAIYCKDLVTAQDIINEMSVQRVFELRDCLAEAVDLVDDIREGDYKPDSFTTQPWRAALKGTISLEQTELEKTLCKQIEALQAKVEEERCILEMYKASAERRIKELQAKVDKYREQDVTADFNYRLEHEELQTKVEELTAALNYIISETDEWICCHDVNQTAKAALKEGK